MIKPTVKIKGSPWLWSYEISGGGMDSGFKNWAAKGQFRIE